MNKVTKNTWQKENEKEGNNDDEDIVDDELCEEGWTFLLVEEGWQLYEWWIVVAVAEKVEERGWSLQVALVDAVVTESAVDATEEDDVNIVASVGASPLN